MCLGAMYYHGMAGLEKDARKAFEVYNLAAERGQTVITLTAAIAFMMTVKNQRHDVISIYPSFVTPL